MRRVIVLAALLLGCAGTVDGPGASADASTSSSGSTASTSADAAGGGTTAAGGACVDCSAAQQCGCHPAGTPLTFCIPCGAGGAGGAP